VLWIWEGKADRSVAQEEILLQARSRTEDDWYQLVLNKFYELGGSRNMMLTVKDVEAKAIEVLGLEDELYMANATVNISR
jgi:hypothetical protein